MKIDVERSREKNKYECYTSTSLLLHELIDEDGNSEGVDSLGSNKEIVVIVDDEAEEDESRHAGNDGEKSLHLWGLSPHP